MIDALCRFLDQWQPCLSHLLPLVLPFVGRMLQSLITSCLTTWLMNRWFDGRPGGHPEFFVVILTKLIEEGLVRD